jgi:uncharacterized protein (TIGR00255 family)
MTGFARTEGLADAIAWRWELRSVNGRGLDLRFRLPNSCEALEPGLRAEAGRLLKRGTVTANLHLQRQESQGLTIDTAQLDRVLALAEALAARIPGAPPLRPEALLALPGVLRMAQTGETEAIPASLLCAARAGFNQAVAALAQARCEEGSRLRAILLTQLDEIAQLHAAASAEAAAQPAAIAARLRAQIGALLQDDSRVPEERLAQEIVLIAARADVREELDRLAAHLDAARALLLEGAAIGRRFDFLVQEFNREANTLCSKSSATALTAIGLRLKTTIEQLREQVQNVE